jgi:hypothetical protein
MKVKQPSAAAVKAGRYSVDRIVGNFYRWRK